MKKQFASPGGTFQNNKPVGSAGQPQNSKVDNRQGAIERRIAKMNKDRGKK